MRKLITIASLLLSNLAMASTLPICSIAGPSSGQSQTILSALTSTPTPAFFIMDVAGKAQFIPPSRAYADILQTPVRSIILNDTEELRFLSQTLAHSNILLVLDGKSSSDFDADKSHKVLSVAKLLDIKVSMLWLGEKKSPKILKAMALQSGGSTFETKDLVQRVDQLCRESVANR
ncbi:MAG: hypothetical protein H7249_17645 [Chitinophagaceae bacterium]|nr:hypothetical protein [Oligoflexus sp.]